MGSCFLAAGPLVCHPSPLLFHSFITKNGRQLCANPSDDWVQDYIKGAGGDLSDPEVAEKDTAQNLKRWG